MNDALLFPHPFKDFTILWGVVAYKWLRLPLYKLRRFSAEFALS